MIKKSLAISLAFFTAAYANPSGALVKEGVVSIESKDNLLQITASDKSIIHWEKFSIDAGEIAQFIQPGSSSIVLNKVSGITPSMINGVLEANGRIVLVNPHGVVVGKHGVINTAEFIASTTDVLDLTDWSIKTDAATLSFEGLGKSLIQHEGVIEATGVDRSGGRVLLVAPQVEVSGTISATQGSIELLGDHIHLLETSVVDVSSPQGGGSILIGGDYRGSNPAVRNSEEAIVDVGALILANATENGSGGKVILWSDDNTDFRGEIQAQGGLLGGDGGFAEVSSAGRWFFDGPVKTTAPLGKTGVLLLDPTDITITTAANSANVVPGVTYTFNPAGTPANIQNTSIQATLGGTNVIIDTLATIQSLANGTITVTAPITWANAHSLTLNAVDNIFIQNQIVCTAGGNITLTTAGGGVYIGSSTATPSSLATTGAGTISITSEVDIVVSASNVPGGTAAISTGNGSITATSNLGTIVIGSATAQDISGIASVGGTIGLTSAKGISINAGTAAGSNATVTSGSPISAQVTGAGDLLISSTGSISSATLGNDVGGGSVTVNLFDGDVNLISTGSSTLFNYAAAIGSADFISITANNLRMTATSISGAEAACGIAVLHAGAPTNSTITLSGDFTMTCALSNLLNIGSPITQIVMNNSNLNFSCAGDFAIGSNSTGFFPDEPGINTNTTGFTTLTVGGNATIFGNNPFGPGQTAFVASQGTGPVTISVGGNILLHALKLNEVFLTSASPTTITAGGDITLMGSINTGISLIGITGVTGPLMMTASGSINVTDHSGIALASNDTGTLIANKNITITQNSSIDTNSGTFGPNSKLILVVDNQAPVFPQISNGSFIIDSTCDIFAFGTPGNPPIQIFTAVRSQNSIIGLINQTAFVPGPFGVNSSEEQWGFYYPQAFVGTPFTIFYKQGGAGAAPGPNLNQAFAKLPVVLGNMFDVLAEFEYPFPYYRGYFTVDYHRKQWPSARSKHNSDMINLDKYYVQVENYRKYHPYRQKFGIRE